MAGSSKPQPAKRGPGRPFQKGQSGNPSGLPKDLAEVIALARSHTATAIKALADIAGDDGLPPAPRVTAAETLLNRAWGKPKDRVELSGPDGAGLGITVTVVRPA